MLKVLKAISELESELERLLSTGKIFDYRIKLKLNMIIEVYIKSDNKECFTPNNYPPTVKVEILDQTEIDTDHFLERIFTEEYETTSKIDYGPMRRLESFNSEPIEKAGKCPVATFYSYKGGMGRTTTLMSYAIHCVANGKEPQKRVVIIDCDFEAPGYLNFFDLGQDLRFVDNKVNGIIEYFLDKEFDDNTPIKNYIIPISDKKIREGCEGNTHSGIYVIPAGNLTAEAGRQVDFGTTNLGHYLQALGRIDFSRSKLMIDKFNSFIKELEKELALTSNDLIIIDSRTGFSDILGITALNLSDLIVGFFGSSEQNKPGLFFILEKYAQMIQICPDVKLLLINSIVPKENGAHTDKFETLISEFWGERPDKPDILPLKRNEKILGMLGVSSDVNKELVDFIKDKSFSFKGIFEKIDSYFVEQSENDSQPKDIGWLRHDIIEKLRNYFSGMKDLSGNYKIYAENRELKQEQFYYRESMKSLFNPNYFIISGFKGTGKTLLYKVLSDNNSVELIRKELFKLANNTVDEDKYCFVHAIKIEGDNTFDFRSFFYEAKKSAVDLNCFFRDFWLLYSWYQIILSLKESINYKSSLEKQAVEMSNKTEREKTSIFFELTRNRDFIIEVEQDLEKLNAFVKKDSNISYVMLLFDHLDDNYKFPTDSMDEWGIFVSPLVSLWQRNTLSSIQPKIFIRTDLFQALQGTNTYILRNRTIPIEWDRNEVYAYFFKLLLSIAKEDFFKLLKTYSGLPKQKVEYILDSIDDYNQLPTEKSILEPLMNLFFGKQISIKRGKRRLFLGNAYSFFYDNLRNANETISLRAFENYIARIVEQAWDNIEIDETRKLRSVISSVHIESGDIRNQVISDHFDDLTKEPYNRDLKFLSDYFKKVLPTYHIHRAIKPDSNLLNEIIENIIDNNKLEKSVSEFRQLMEHNGIIAQNGKIYRYAKMYQYWWGLKSDIDEEELKFNISDYNKTINSFKRQLQIGGIYEVSIFGVLIYQATKKKLSDYGLTSSEPIIEKLEESGCIEQLEGLSRRKCKFLKFPEPCVFGLDTETQTVNHKNSIKRKAGEYQGTITCLLTNPHGDRFGGYIECAELDKTIYFHSSCMTDINIINANEGDLVFIRCSTGSEGQLISKPSPKSGIEFYQAKEVRHLA